METDKKAVTRVFFDMDDVLTDFTGELESHPNILELKNKFYFAAERARIGGQPYDVYEKMFKAAPHMESPLKTLWDDYNNTSKLLVNSKGFFSRLLPLPGAERLLVEVSSIFGVIPDILTSPAHESKWCRREKADWMRRYFYGKYGNFWCTDDKWRHANPEENTILIDDRRDYCDSFVEHGGFAILHTSVEDTLNKCKELSKNLLAKH